MAPRPDLGGESLRQRHDGPARYRRRRHRPARSGTSRPGRVPGRISRPPSLDPPELALLPCRRRDPPVRDRGLPASTQRPARPGRERRDPDLGRIATPRTIAAARARNPSARSHARSPLPLRASRAPMVPDAPAKLIGDQELRPGRLREGTPGRLPRGSPGRSAPNCRGGRCTRAASGRARGSRTACSTRRRPSRPEPGRMIGLAGCRCQPVNPSRDRARPI